MVFIGAAVSGGRGAIAQRSGSASTLWVAKVAGVQPIMATPYADFSPIVANEVDLS